MKDDLINLKIWAEYELNKGHRSKASRINKIYEKYLNKLSPYEQKQIVYSINEYKAEINRMRAQAELIRKEFFEKVL